MLTTGRADTRYLTDQKSITWARIVLQRWKHVLKIATVRTVCECVEVESVARCITLGPLDTIKPIALLVFFKETEWKLG